MRNPFSISESEKELMKELIEERPYIYRGLHFIIMDANWNGVNDEVDKLIGLDWTLKTVTFHGLIYLEKK